MVELNFSKTPDGLIPAIAQDAETGDILMLAYMNAEAWEKTLATGVATYWSRSRNKLWVKGETSGKIQHVREIRVDCDLDTVVLRVEQVGGAACHEGFPSCFFRQVKGDQLVIIQDRLFDPKAVYKNG
ncbi:MAG: phosphoribosyl-AMP cyclohydrolase [Lentisphaeria bacterium]|nr:phosphoribosyl-AMP cyclohydrolase [Lentisphaeria bacterium]